MHERPFVLLPLADIQPEVAHPQLGRTVSEILAGLGSGEGLRLGDASSLRVETAAATTAAAVGSEANSPAGTGGAERVLPLGVCGNGETR